MKWANRILSLLADLLLSPIVLVATLILWQARRSGLHKKPVSRWIFDHVGIFPLRDHYYEPLYHTRRLDPGLRERRILPGLNLNLPGQLETLQRFDYNAELLALPRSRQNEHEFYYHNGAFEAGDAEFLYSILRTFKPARLLEIGSGQSTLMARAALTRNRAGNPASACRHLCIEPYEQPWLENLGIEIRRTPVEKLKPELFRELQANDVLFIDSSHMIRPQGDVLFEYLEVLPVLQPGVLVHVHDIFTPRDYPNEWLIDKIRFWNEQYLLEAFLTGNRDFEVIGAVNFLAHDHPEELAAKCPVFAAERGQCEPGSFWLRKIA